MKSTKHIQGLSRRKFVSAGVVVGSTGLLAGLKSAAQASPEASITAAPAAKVRFAELLPHEFRRRLAERPIAYLPLARIFYTFSHRSLLCAGTGLTPTAWLKPMRARWQNRAQQTANDTMTTVCP